MARKKRGNPVHGWVIVDKPLDVTSTQVVGRVRRLFNAQKAGHGGTLDPLASGILPIALGEATKTMPFIQDGRKGYRFSVRWGTETATCDLEGDVTESGGRVPEDAEIEAALPAFTGSIEQAPPAYSAIKIGGERAYDLARRGETPEMKVRTIEIHRIAHLGREAGGDSKFEVDCGSGTYVRSLARDIARHLGTFGHVSALRRVFVGSFGESRAISLEMLESLGHGAPAFEHLLPVSTALDDIPALAVTREEIARIRRGQEVVMVGRALERGCTPEILTVHSAIEPVWARAGRGQEADPVALGHITGGRFRPTRVFNIDS